MIIQGVTLNGVRVVDASIITQNLAIWIDANNSSSYSGTGTIITDLSGNSRTQNLSNAAAYTMLNGVKCFDCTNTYNIRAAVAGPTLPTTGFTYIAWARMNSSSATWRTLFRGSPNDHAILIEIGSNRLGMYDNTTSAFYPSGYNDVSSLADVWVQWAVTGNSSGQTFYINGQQVGTTVQTAAGNAHDYTGQIPGQPFGYVANMELYTTILTQEQILQNYYNQLPKFATPGIVTSNLVLWYDPSNSVSYPGSGSTITNLASTSLNGTMSNITYTSPYFGYNGSSSQINVPDNALLEPGTGDWTMEAWVYLSSSSGSKVVLGKFDPGGGSQDVSYSIRISGAGIYAQIGNGSTVVDTPLYTLPLNTWTHVVYVWKNVATNSLEAYINGVSVASVSHSFSSILNTSANLYIGSYNGGEYSQYMNGRIGITRLYSAALTSAQVLQNYNASKATYGL
jgi:hypothetical protein